jgi:DNA-binding LytR/AlgR family response regulator
MKVLIADDEPIAREILREHLETMPSAELIGEAANGNEAVEQILAAHPDLVLLDLEMPGLDGLSVVKQLRGTEAPAIVFVTAYPEHALSAFEVGAVDYLVKPVRRERLEQAFEKVAKLLAGRKASKPDLPKKIVGRRGSDMYLLDPAEIIAFEAEGETVHIIAGGQKYLCEFTLKALEDKLDPARFRRIHRKTIINTEHIRRVSPLSSKRWLLKMSNGMEAIVSKRLASSIREQTKW